MSKLPRITKSLRMSTCLEGREFVFKPNDIIRKRQERAEKQESKLDWCEICNNASKDLGILLQKLKKLAEQVLEDISPDASNEFTVYVLCLLIEDEKLTRKKYEMLNQKAGYVEFNDAHEMMELVAEIRSNYYDEIIQLLSETKENADAETPSLHGFGADIPYNPTRVVWPDTSILHNMSTEGINSTTDKFTMKLYGAGSSVQKKSVFDKAKFMKGLTNCFKICGKGSSFSEFKTAIVEKLRDSQDAALQTELFDMLGCNHLEFIEYIIEHQQAIVSAHSCQKIVSRPQKPAQGPIISGQVTVQSEKEKMLNKQVRKEEKKLNKMSNKRDVKADIEKSELDSAELRFKKQEAFVSRNTPLFPKKFIPEKNSNYPFVFDCKANKHASIVSGQKLLLAEDVTRKNSNLCEEVHIPISEREPINVKVDFVSISSLDKIGQIAFNGMKSLNQIQSIVFKPAYETNENLLVCAPTGAGKTNVAMLTIVHQLKQNIQDGQLQTDQFKIIYVAPMKALAAEMTANFNKRLSALGVKVREYTGDMQLTKQEIQQTQMIVTTPEKWDVVTRKGKGDVSLSSIVKLLIIDEVHLLHGDRGPVVEALVARTLRQVESTQSMIRIVGLSATLPNYVDVARFLRVNPYKGLFYFDHRFRPVPLSQTFVGVKAIKPLQMINDMDLVCYNHVMDMVRQGHQVMVFVHARNATVKTALALKELATRNETLKYFLSESQAKHMNKAFASSRNKHLGELFNSGFSVHHAGMTRTDRNLVEKYFADGLIKVLVCTATLAWGVNLPAHAVIIRGTEIYDAKHGSFVDLGILDVLQIFGRAGRPQFDTSGHAVIITTHNKLSHYLSLLTNQIPIESSFVTYLADNLNAEVTLGTISNVEEAVEWLSYTYLFVRMKLNYQVYGILYQTLVEDPNLEKTRKELVVHAAKALDKAQMIRYDERTGDLSATDLGRIASHYYLKYDTVEIFNQMQKPMMTEAEILEMISHAQEFQQLKVRDDEVEELDQLFDDCKVVAKGGVENIYGKVNILLQTYLSRGRVNASSLISDQAYVTQNATRIVRALFEVMLRKNNAIMAGRLLTMAKMFEAQQWDYMTPLRQFSCLSAEIIYKIERRELPIHRLKEMATQEIGVILRDQRMALLVKKCCLQLPKVDVMFNLQPITRTVLRLRLTLIPEFSWNDHAHGKNSQLFCIWIEDPDSNFIYHYEDFLLTRKAVVQKIEQELVITIPLSEPLPAQYLIKVSSAYWLGCDDTFPVSFHDLILPETHPPHTDLLELQPLPTSALKDPSYEELYTFSHFNPIQTQIFHCLYHTDSNVLLGAPTGSGKTIAAEIAMFRVFKRYPGKKVVYIAPLKALVRERINDWKVRLEERLGKKVVELTGDVSPDIKMIIEAQVIVTTPEKWDGISRSWQTRSYVREVALIVIDEIHLLGEDRGPVLEVIVSRTNFISSHTQDKVRIVGLSTALANAVDLANWLNIKDMGLYNFRPSVRPVPLEVHISGFPGKQYCPRMATMNRPTFQAIRHHAPSSPSLVFVSSRRQTRLTALDLIAYLAAEDNPKQWLHMPEEQMADILENVKDTNLKLTLAFGIGLHHAGLQDRDRKTVEELFVNSKIQVLITTATLAWGVNFPAHLVVIKGTEYYDGKLQRYVDMPITDVLQMMGRAGRPQYDNSGVAVVLVQDTKKSFYKKFLYEPFPVESSLMDVLPDHINAEIVAGTMKNEQEFLDYLTWTYYFRRLMKNPKYYDLDILEPQCINEYLSKLVKSTLRSLMDSHCIDYDTDERTLFSLPIGKIASFYYLSHHTMLMFTQSLNDKLTLDQCLRILCNSHEYNELPVRHNEELLNEELAKLCRYPVDQCTYDSPHTKAFLLLQSHFSRLPPPCSDYITDLKSVLDQAIRILQAMVDTVAERGWLTSTITTMYLFQMIVQARWIDESAITTLPHVKPTDLQLFSSLSTALPMLCHIVTRDNCDKLATVLCAEYTLNQIREIYRAIRDMPVISVDLTLESMTHNEVSRQKIKFKRNNDEPIDVRKDEYYTLIVGLRRNNHSKTLKANSPMFLKGKDEGWFLVLGEIVNKELLALKRVSGVNDQQRYHQLQFHVPNRLGSMKLTFYLISDCYMGLDQQYDIFLNVTSSFRTPAQD
ncbi:PREDICTED: activating signal cointegrator 1 complex subunit 3 [Dinoponera quadriceps]|uniref:Activating signal cointegrator 1 complex subunit 3 n=1 Tax=Dinoponera quadriceps TaxID=609295 RepID=A0A6P3X2F1_DINQU|nr:PREDICTED: activating signal cointegrator 1 complex subunit 3 [Dinoponera quadriceps]XP_014472479.1 PREDICTED: activating signal cointegrator 1 complex subunit 3 [Dinoponera quadriceps]XP_014472480.1 PREDICTED: activating signal cointegrator 1 complex subunit 3 [Dinoponera quadriceps]